MRLHLKPALGEIKLPALRGDQVQRLLAEKTDSGLSSRSVQYIHSVLHRALKHAVRWGLVVRNVAELADSPRVQRRPMKTLTPEQARTFLAGTRDDRLHALYVVALFTGMRQGEILGLHWADVDLERCTIHVVSALQPIKGQGIVQSELKTDASRRQIVVSVPVVAALRRHRTRQLEERLFFGPDWTDTGLVFTTGHGKPLHNSVVTHDFQDALERLGLPRLRFHDLRHTAATLLLAQGTHPKIVQEMLGHAQIALTLDTYSHVLPSMQAEAAEKMRSLLEG